MRNALVTALLTVGMVGTASAQVAGSSGTNTNTNEAAAASAPATASFSDLTNAFLAASPINQKGSVGVGALLGEPMGVTVKYWLSDTMAVDGGLGWSFVDPDGTQLHGDVLFHKFDLLRSDTRDLPLYVGVGGRVKFVEHGDNRAGIRVPLGASYLLPSQHLEFFAEVAPILDLAPSTTLEWNGGVGIRFYFH